MILSGGVGITGTFISDVVLALMKWMNSRGNMAFALLSASLSAKGLTLSKDIMKLNGTLAELANNFDEYGEWLYWITVMGDPSSSEPWGWQIDGHHLIINYLFG